MFGKNFIPFIITSMIGTAIAIAVMSRIPALWNIVKKPGA